MMLSVFFNTLKEIANILVASLRARCFEDGKGFIII